MTRLLILVSGVAGVVIPQVGSWGLPSNVQVAITSVGGALLAIMALLEHPTTKSIATPTTTTKGS